MADSRRHARGRGKSDGIDAIAVAQAALREGLDALPAAQLEGPELDLRLLVDHRERLVRQRVTLNNTLQWHLHDIWPELRLPGSSLFYGEWGPRVARRLARTEQTMRVRIALPFRALGALALQESAHRRGMSSCCLCPVDNAPCRMLSSLRAHARRRRHELGVGSRCSRSSLRLSRFPRPRSAQ